MEHILNVYISHLLLQVSSVTIPQLSWSILTTSAAKLISPVSQIEVDDYLASSKFYLSLLQHKTSLL